MRKTIHSKAKETLSASQGITTVFKSISHWQCYSIFHWLKQNNLLLSLQQTHSLTPGKSLHMSVPQLLLSTGQRFWDPWRFVQIYGVRKWNTPLLWNTTWLSMVFLTRLHEGLGGSGKYIDIFFSCSQRILLLPFPLNMHIRETKYWTGNYGYTGSISMSNRNSSFVHWSIYNKALLFLTLLFCKFDKPQALLSKDSA